MNNIVCTKLVAIFLWATLVVSCQKFLEEEPRNSTYNDVFWNEDPDAGKKAIAGNYALLRNALMNGFSGVGNRYYIYGDMTPNIYIGIYNDGYGHQAIGEGNWTSNYMVQGYGNWTLFYKVIAWSNMILKEMERVPAEVLSLEQDNPEAYRRNILGQAYFIRAFTYFSLTKVWGDVPLVVEAYDDPISAPHLPRASRMDVLQQIEDDCHAAAELLEWGYRVSGDRNVTANKGAAYALLSHLYLWRATTSDLSTNQPVMKDVLSADTTITSLLAHGGYSLVDTARYASVFEGRSSEGIFEINVSENTLEGSSAHIGMKFLNNDYIPTYGANADFFVNPSYLNNHFYKVETRFDWVWHEEIKEYVWEEVSANVLDTADVRFKNNFANYTSERPILTKYSNIVFRNPGQLLEPFMSNNLILFRLSDIKLLQAEIALYKDNVNEAIRIINEFRSRYGASNTALIAGGSSKEIVLSEYILERGKELYLEGHLFYDLIRTRECFNQITWLTQSRFAQGGFFWPVDPRLFSENRHLVQTEYWRGKI